MGVAYTVAAFPSTAGVVESGCELRLFYFVVAVKVRKFGKSMFIRGREDDNHWWTKRPRPEKHLEWYASPNIWCVCQARSMSSVGTKRDFEFLVNKPRNLASG